MMWFQVCKMLDGYKIMSKKEKANKVKTIFAAIAILGALIIVVALYVVLILAPIEILFKAVLIGMLTLLVGVIGLGNL